MAVAAEVDGNGDEWVVRAPDPDPAPAPAHRPPTQVTLNAATRVRARGARCDECELRVKGFVQAAGRARGGDAAVPTRVAIAVRGQLRLGVPGAGGSCRRGRGLQGRRWPRGLMCGLRAGV